MKKLFTKKPPSTHSKRFSTKRLLKTHFFISLALKKYKFFVTMKMTCYQCRLRHKVFIFTPKRSKYKRATKYIISIIVFLPLYMSISDFEKSGKFLLCVM